MLRAMELFFFVILLILWDAQVILATLIRLMATKMEEPILHVEGWVNGQVEIEVVRLYSWMHYEGQVLSPLCNQEPDWEWVSGLGLAQ